MYRIVGIAAFALAAMAPELRAQLITGGLSFTGGIRCHGATSIASATNVTAWINPQAAVGASGTFATGPEAVASGTPVSVAAIPWNFNTTQPVANFFSVGGFKFEMCSSQVYSQAAPGGHGFVTVAGSGVVSGNGFTPTACAWIFTSQDPSLYGTWPDYVWTFTVSISSLNTNGAPVLTSCCVGGATVLTWNDPTFVLQAADSPGGGFVNIPGATSPYTNTFTTTHRFFRLVQ